MKKKKKSLATTILLLLLPVILFVVRPTIIHYTIIFVDSSGIRATFIQQSTILELLR